MGESLFSSDLRSLRMDRRSPEAAKLREAVSKKLLDFLGNYSDEVLAEYIVVLVCNGKHQNQARDDLHAFLGEESGAFVAWLWNFLSEEFIGQMTPGVPNPEAKGTTKNNEGLERENKNHNLTDLHFHSIGPSKTKNGSFELPPCHENSDHLKTFRVSEPSPSNLDGCSAKVNMDSLTVLYKDSGSKSGNFTGVAKIVTSSIKCSSHEVASVDEQSLHCELQNWKIQKSSSSTVPSQHLPEPQTEQSAVGLRSIIAEEHQLRPSSSTNSADTRMLSIAAVDLSNQTAPLRGNVWDRLGRPRVLDQRLTKEEHSHHLDFIEAAKQESQGEESKKPRLMRISPVASSTSSLSRQANAVDRGGTDGISVKLSVDCRSDKVDSICHLKRKIEVGEFDSNDGMNGNYLQNKEHPEQQRQLLSIKHKSQQNIKKFARVIDRSVSSDSMFGLVNTADMGPDSRATVVSKFQVKKDSVTTSMKNLVPVNNADMVPDSRAAVVSKSQVKKDLVATSMTNPVPVNTILPSNSVSPIKTDGGHANQKPNKDDMLAVKSKLQQIEMDMLKLRSKQVGWSSDGKLNVSSVVQTPTEENIECRTVLVANVHFAATKESLISHFGKCGFIAKVIMLTDAVTGLPKGAAYIVFANKESVDKAISLSGTSLFSRILKVIRKVEVPPDYLVPSQPTLKQQQPFYPPPYGKNPMQKPHTSSHLQWRRDQRSTGDNSLSALSNGLGPSSSVE